MPSPVTPPPIVEKAQPKADSTAQTAILADIKGLDFRYVIRGLFSRDSKIVEIPPFGIPSTDKNLEGARAICESRVPDLAKLLPNVTQAAIKLPPGKVAVFADLFKIPDSLPLLGTLRETDPAAIELKLTTTKGRTLGYALFNRATLKVTDFRVLPSVIREKIEFGVEKVLTRHRRAVTDFNPNSPSAKRLALELAEAIYASGDASVRITPSKQQNASAGSFDVRLRWGAGGCSRSSTADFTVRFLPDGSGVVTLQNSSRSFDQLTSDFANFP